MLSRHGISVKRAPDFPIRKESADFMAAVEKLETEYGISSLEAACIKRTKAYNGGDHILWHIARLDNLRKHERLIVVEPILTEADFTFRHGERVMEHSHSQSRTILYRIPRGELPPRADDALHC